MNIIEKIGLISSIFGILSFFKIDVEGVYTFFKNFRLFLLMEQEAVASEGQKKKT